MPVRERRVYGPSIVLRLRAVARRLLGLTVLSVAVPFLILADRHGVLDETALAAGFTASALVISAVSALSLFVLSPVRVVTTPTRIVLMRGRRRCEQWPRRSVRFMETATGDGFLAWSSGDAVEIRCSHYTPEELAALLGDLGAASRARPPRSSGDAPPLAAVRFRPQSAPVRGRSIAVVLVATEALAAVILALALSQAHSGDRLHAAVGSVVVASALPLVLVALRLALRRALPAHLVVSDSAIEVDGVVFPLESLREVRASDPAARHRPRLTLVETSGRVTEVPLGSPLLTRHLLFADYPLLVSELRARTAPRPGLLSIES